jgi:hypothetical protein
MPFYGVRSGALKQLIRAGPELNSGSHLSLPVQQSGASNAVRFVVVS